MPTPTYDLIASNVLSSSAASVTFSSIPATYRDLVLVCSMSVSTTGQLRFRFNNDSDSNYSTVVMAGSGTIAESGVSNNTTYGFLTYFQNPSTTQANSAIMQVLDYSATDKQKTTLLRYGAASTTTEAAANRYASTSAINRIDIIRASGDYLSGSTFYLYGIVS